MRNQDKKISYKESREIYRARINRVIDYIDNNIYKPLRLERLAEISGFSPFYFHKIFGALMGETVNQFIQRVRLEKAATLLLTNPKESITDISFDCGFSSSSAFARAFRDAFGVSASQWRKQVPATDDKNCKVDGKEDQLFAKIGKDIHVSRMYINGVTQNFTWRITMKDKVNPKKEVEVQVKDLPGMTVAYVRHIGPYQGDSDLFARLFEKLFKWAGARDLLHFPETQVMSIYHDNPEITDPDKLRTSVCITVAEDTEVDGDVGKMSLPGGKYAVARFELAQDEYQEAWDALMGAWFPQSGYQPDDRPCFELYRNDPQQHPEGKCIVDICVPVKPL